MLVIGKLTWQLSCFYDWFQRPETKVNHFLQFETQGKCFYIACSDISLKIQHVQLSEKVKMSVHKSFVYSKFELSWDISWPHFLQMAHKDINQWRLWWRRSTLLWPECCYRGLETITWEVMNTSAILLTVTQLAFTCSKLPIETLEKGVKYVQS